MFKININEFKKYIYNVKNKLGKKGIIIVCSSLFLIGNIYAGDYKKNNESGLGNGFKLSDIVYQPNNIKLKDFEEKMNAPIEISDINGTNDGNIVGNIVGNATTEMTVTVGNDENASTDNITNNDDNYQNGWIFRFPMDDSDFKYISSGYGYRSLRTISGNFHRGIDIVPYNGASGKVHLYSIVTGEVIYVNDGCPDGAYMMGSGMSKACLNTGNSVKILTHIKNSNGTVTDLQIWYLHLEEGTLQVKVGDKVKPGDYIGNVGNSGISTGYHLHLQFVLEDDGQGNYVTLDPFPYLLYDASESIAEKLNAPVTEQDDDLIITDYVYSADSDDTAELEIKDTKE